VEREIANARLAGVETTVVDVSRMAKYVRAAVVATRIVKIQTTKVMEKSLR
jgi:hypothetical protein